MLALRNLDSNSLKLRTNLGQSQDNQVIISDAQPVSFLRSNLGVIEPVVCPPQTITEYTSPVSINPNYNRLRTNLADGSGDAIASNKNPIIFEFNNNLNNTGTDEWAAKFLSPTGSNLSYSTTAKTGSHSASFNGSSSYISCSSFTGDFFSLGSNDFSFELDLYFSSTSGNIAFFGKHQSSGYSFMAMLISGSLYWVKNANYSFIATLPAISLSFWYNLKIVRSGSTTSFYWDNILVGTFAESGDYNANSTSLNIGRNGDAAWYFKGLIDNFKFYKRAII